MRGMRLRISWLIGAVAFSAIGLAALKQASPLVDQFVFTATSAAIGAAILLAIHRRGPERAFWTGFALIGGLYFWASTSPEMRPRLITSHLFADLARRLPEPGWPAVGSQHQQNTAQMTSRSDTTDYGKPIRLTRLWDTWGVNESTVPVGHGLFAWIAGWIGGIASRAIRARAKRKAWPGLRGH